MSRSREILFNSPTNATENTETVTASQRPDGRKIRSKPQLARHLGDSFELSTFDFRTGRIIHNALRKQKRNKGSPYDIARGLRHDSALALPIRQTASIFKQPVTVIRNRPESKTKTELKHGVQEQPRQLFWEKRLQGIKPCDSNEEKLLSMELPKNMQGVGPDLTNENVLQSISAALHLNTTVPITGQCVSRSSIQKNPGVHIDSNQPHIQLMTLHWNELIELVPKKGHKLWLERKNEKKYQNFNIMQANLVNLLGKGLTDSEDQSHQSQQMIISDDDIRKQELIVLEARKRLQDVMKE